MRKVSEILRIGTRFHYAWQGDGHACYMCHALFDAKLSGLISEEELSAGEQFCEELLGALGGKCAYGLKVALEALKVLDYADDDYMETYLSLAYLIYEACIDKLESEGK